MENGRIVLGACSGGICAPNPRTGIGLTADGRIVLVVIDGRQRRLTGMSLPSVATLLRCASAPGPAINLDGGGSSVMV